MKNKFKFFIISYFAFLCLSVVSRDNDCGPFPNNFKIVDLYQKTHESNFIESQNNQLNLVEIVENYVNRVNSFKELFLVRKIPGWLCLEDVEF